jgi:hypothetical protein
MVSHKREKLLLLLGILPAMALALLLLYQEEQTFCIWR